jgi:hypothetical protein
LRRSGQGEDHDQGGERKRAGQSHEQWKMVCDWPVLDVVVAGSFSPNVEVEPRMDTDKNG